MFHLMHWARGIPACARSLDSCRLEGSALSSEHIPEPVSLTVEGAGDSIKISTRAFTPPSSGSNHGM